MRDDSGLIRRMRSARTRLEQTLFGGTDTIGRESIYSVSARMLLGVKNQTLSQLASDY